MEIKSFENKLWLSSPTMHGDELKYMKEAYDTNWMSMNPSALRMKICQKNKML